MLAGARCSGAVVSHRPRCVSALCLLLRRAGCASWHTWPRPSASWRSRGAHVALPRERQRDDGRALAHTCVGACAHVRWRRRACGCVRSRAHSLTGVGAQMTTTSLSSCKKMRCDHPTKRSVAWLALPAVVCMFHVVCCTSSVASTYRTSRLATSPRATLSVAQNR